MIHEIGVELQAYLRSKGCPFDVIDGPDRRPTTTYARERVVIENDPDTSDQFESRHRADTNPRTWCTRKTGVRVRIYAQDGHKGAMFWEHRRRVDQALDLVVCGLFVSAKKRGNIMTLRSGRYIDPPDLKPSETPGGAVYELLLFFDRGVADRNWDGTAQPTATITPQMVGGPSLTFNAAAHTITRSFGSWLVDKFAVGQTVIVSGTASNNGTFGPITGLTATVMTFASGLVNETAPTAAITGNGVVITNTNNASGLTQDGGASTETV